jgi:2-oxoacid:acceptor oxidoreductase gamma subunit (pyruvate/2-ketoisovalerate family)
MFEMRFHGRGGQGAVMASKILAKALVEEGHVAKAIPSFGFERRGAPVSAFLRFDDKEIRQVTNIYNPDCIVCIDPTLSKSVDIFEGINDNAVLVQATKKKISQLSFPDTISKVGVCDAFGLAMEIIGRPITNTIMLGVFAKTTGLVSIDSINKAMESVAFRDAALSKNIEAVRRGYDSTTVLELKRKETA